MPPWRKHGLIVLLYHIFVPLVPGIVKGNDLEYKSIFYSGVTHYGWNLMILGSCQQLQLGQVEIVRL